MRRSRVPLRHAGALLAACMLTGAAGHARAGVVNLDFGTLAANPDGHCASDCVFPTIGAYSFTSSGVTVTATGYSAAPAAGTVAFLTQKPGAFGPETGLGESDTAPHPSDADFEIAPGKFVVLNNSAAIAAGATQTSLSIGSLQGGESAEIFTGASLASLTLLATLTGPPVTQTISLPSSAKFVEVEGIANNVVIVEEAFRTPAPEPATLAVLGTGLFGLSLARRRRG